MKGKTMLIAAVSILMLLIGYGLLRRAYCGAEMSDNITGILIYHHGTKKTIWINRTDEIRQLWEFGFHRWSRPDDGFRWMTYDADSFLILVGKNGEMTGIVHYYEPGKAAGGRAFLQIQGERRYFLVDEEWREWLLNILSEKPEVYEISFQLEGDLLIDSVVKTSYRLGLDPLAAIWRHNTFPVGSRYLHLLFSEEIAPEQVNALKQELSSSE